MSQDTGWILVILIGGALILMSGAWRPILGWLVGPPNIRLVDLEDLFPSGAVITINRDPARKMPDADVSVQLRAEDVSIFYHRTLLDTGATLVETIDISAPPLAGIIVTFRDGEVSVFERIGGGITHHPRLMPEEQRSATWLLRRIRNVLAEEKLI